VSWPGEEHRDDASRSAEAVEGVHPAAVDAIGGVHPAAVDAIGGVHPAAVEALLFAAEGPVSPQTLRDVLARADSLDVAEGDVERVLRTLQVRFANEDRGFALVEVGAGWELRTRPAYAAYVHELYRNPPVRLTRAALEVLAIVAYRQPCTRADVEEIRGVDCSRMLRTLLERSLVRIIGKADDVGRPLLYGTTPGFLEFFGLASLSELPTLKDYTELTEEHLVKLQALDETLRANEATPPQQLDLPSASDATLPDDAPPERAVKAPTDSDDTTHRPESPDG
jgi:segregation and condensation protein B